MKPEGDRSDWTEMDLLTTGEASLRLLEVAAQLRSQIREQRPEHAGREAIAGLEAKLTQVEEALRDLRAQSTSSTG
jgi:hypothetical protein